MKLNMKLEQKVELRPGGCEAGLHEVVGQLEQVRRGEFEAGLREVIGCGQRQSQVQCLPGLGKS